MKSLSVVNKISREPVSNWLNTVLQSWLEAWFVVGIADSAKTELQFNDALFLEHEIQKEDGLYQSPKGSGCLLFSDLPTTLPKLALLALGVLTNSDKNSIDQTESLVETLKSRLVGDLISRLMPVDSSTSQDSTDKFSSAIKVIIHVGEIQICFHLNIGLLIEMGAYKHSESEQVSSLVSREIAVAQRSTKIQVGLHGTQLTLDELLSLKPGDVVSLRHSLDQSVLLATNDAPIEINAYLVKSEGSKALLLSE